ncbi:MAG: hypothetical protein IKC49_00535, partial [Clostridia bacterium]|nr:hypothetical protein [Clostridia bacterium]
MSKSTKPNFHVKHPYGYLIRSILLGLVIMLTGIFSVCGYNIFSSSRPTIDVDASAGDNGNGMDYDWIDPSTGNMYVWMMTEESSSFAQNHNVMTGWAGDQYSFSTVNDVNGLPYAQSQYSGQAGYTVRFGSGSSANFRTSFYIAVPWSTPYIGLFLSSGTSGKALTFNVYYNCETLYGTGYSNSETITNSSVIDFASGKIVNLSSYSGNKGNSDFFIVRVDQFNQSTAGATYPLFHMIPYLNASNWMTNARIVNRMYRSYKFNEYMPSSYSDNWLDDNSINVAWTVDAWSSSDAYSQAHASYYSDTAGSTLKQNFFVQNSKPYPIANSRKIDANGLDYVDASEGAQQYSDTYHYIRFDNSRQDDVYITLNVAIPWTLIDKN